MASMTNVHVNPLKFCLSNLSSASLMRSAMSVSHSSSFVESCSLKTAMSCSSELVRFDCFCLVHKVFVYCCITSLKGSVGVGGGGGWSAIERFEVHALCSPRSLLVVLLQPLLIDISHLSPLWMLLIYHDCCIQGSSGWPSASDLPKATVVSELWVLSLSISVGSGSPAWRSTPLSNGHPAPLWWGITCVLYVVQ